MSTSHAIDQSAALEAMSAGHADYAAELLAPQKGRPAEGDYLSPVDEVMIRAQRPIGYALLAIHAELRAADYRASRARSAGTSPAQEPTSRDERHASDDGEAGG